MPKLHGHSLPDTAALQDFIALASTKSFSTAARQRHITQPAFSRRIQGLERDLGATLINRASTPLSLTRAGEAFLPFAEGALRELADGVEIVHSVFTELHDPVTVATTHTIAVSFFPRWLKQLQSRGGLFSHDQPCHVVLNTYRAERCFRDVLGGRAELGLCLVPHNDGAISLPNGLTSKTIASDDLIAVHSPRLKLKIGNKKSPIPALMFPPGSELRSEVTRMLLATRLSAEFNSVFESPSGEVLKSMALNEFGVAWLPRMLCREELASNQLKQLVNAKLTSRITLVLFRAHMELSPRATVMWEGAEHSS